MSRPIGLIGVGLMGTAIAERLIQHQFEVIGWDLNADQLTGLSGVGGQVAENTLQVFRDCDTVVLSLPNDDIVRNVIDENASQLRSGHFIIDTSTGAPQAVLQMAESLKKRGLAYLDATISGSSAQVRDGSAIAIVGASKTALLACQSILSAITPQVLHVGPPGSGSKMKLVTNLVLGLNRAALAEGLAFARSLGLSLESSLTVLKSSMAYSRIMDSKGSKMIAQEYAPHAKLDQHAKDVRLMLASAQLSDIDLPLTETHLKLLEHVSQLGFGELDNSAIIEAYQPKKSHGESKS